MIKKYLTLILISFFFIPISLGAETQNKISNPDDTVNEPKGSTKTSNYNLAVKFITKGNKYDKKNKKDKAEKYYKKAFKYLLKSNKEFPAKANTFKYLGYVNRKLGNFEDAEIYYLLGLEIAPKHFGINEYLGKLYVNTNRIDLAKERLKVLEKCNCEEFKELNNFIKLSAS